MANKGQASKELCVSLLLCRKRLEAKYKIYYIILYAYIYICKIPLLTRWVGENIDLRVDGERDSAEKTDAPQGGYDAQGPLEAAHRIQV